MDRKSCPGRGRISNEELSESQYIPSIGPAPVFSSLRSPPANRSSSFCHRRHVPNYHITELDSKRPAQNRGKLKGQVVFR